MGGLKAIMNLVLKPQFDIYYAYLNIEKENNLEIQ